MKTIVVERRVTPNLQTQKNSASQFREAEFFLSNQDRLSRLHQFDGLATHGFRIHVDEIHARL